MFSAGHFREGDCAAGNCPTRPALATAPSRGETAPRSGHSRQGEGNLLRIKRRKRLLSLGEGFGRRPATFVRRVRQAGSHKYSSFSILFLDTARSTPYIGPVNARSAPAAASRRPQKKRTKKQAGSFPLSGPPPPIGHPIPHPMRRPVRGCVRRPLRRRGLTAGPCPVRPSASAAPCRPAVPPPVLSALPLGREAGKFPIRIVFAALPIRNFPAFPRGSGASRAFESKEKRL